MADGKFRNKPGYGNVFKEEVEEGSNRPLWKGKITTPDDCEYELAMWPKNTKEGKEMMQIKIEEPYNKDESPI
jgi:hypothetical protein|tara:strand:+ start:13461 stop:13679 length:219 start_codon:yes stop_codon:yes gene_type:complete